MTPKDRIQLFGNGMLIEFAATGVTGSISALPLDRGVRFASEGESIMAYVGLDAPPTLIEKFSSPAIASNGYQYLQSMLRRHVTRCRVRNAVKKVLLWGVVPTMTTILALSLNVAVTRGMNANAAGLPVRHHPALAVQEATGQTISSDQMAQAMADGVKSGRYSLLRSAAGKSPLYIFADPACGACHKLEPVLDQLGKRYTIHIFPVSVIGGYTSAKRAGLVMCKESRARATAWKQQYLRNDHSSLCQEGNDAVAANDKIFAAMGFTGTPTIINASGQLIPTSVRWTDAGIGGWLAKSGQ